MITAIVIHLWQSTVFAAAAGALTLAFRRNRAAVRFGVWACASLKFFIPFALLLNLGSRLPVRPALAGQIAPPEISFAVERIAEPILAPAASSRDWSPVIVGVWACGVLTIVLLRARQGLRIRAMVRAGTRLPIAAPVEVRSAPGALEPGVVGVFRPILLLPEGIAERLTPRQLEAVLAHEFCHVRRRDNLFAAIHMIGEALFWFHPLVWWIGARMVEERERACDEGVLNLGGEPRTYADAILNICKLYVESPLACVSGVTGANLKRRIEAIMTNRIGKRLSVTKKLALTGAAAAALAGPIAMGVLIGAGNALIVRAQTPTPKPPDAPVAVAQSTPAPAPAPDEHARRIAEAQAKFGSTTSPMARTYIRYGAPDRVEELGASQVWHYHHVDFEFTGSGPTAAVRILQPPPLATFDATPAIPAALADALSKELERRGQVSSPNVIAGLPAGHASFQTYPAGELQTLSIPLETFSGKVDVLGQIKYQLNGVAQNAVAMVRDVLQAPANYQSRFTLMAGLYVCDVVVRDQTTGQIYGESINFEVK